MWLYKEVLDVALESLEDYNERASLFVSAVEGPKKVLEVAGERDDHLLGLNDYNMSN